MLTKFAFKVVAIAPVGVAAIDNVPPLALKGFHLALDEARGLKAELFKHFALMRLSREADVRRGLPPPNTRSPRVGPSGCCTDPASFLEEFNRPPGRGPRLATQSELNVS
ncbi:hypothetical protein EVAR_53585_1 [Eumeta japonica]|uniref:Uncharacterized protein n=1 Tax=Eumeta variegata TaxID=151549 RepID=A0A4C1YKM6_EUMVA|nr:hypothetical protein EVAR_53585_1 [Eumeta japonica]